MEFNQSNKSGDNKVIFTVNGDFTDQSNKIQKFVTDKDRQARIANWIAFAAMIIGLIGIIIAILK